MISASKADSSLPSSTLPVGDGFTADELADALRPKPAEPWHPAVDYDECDIRDLNPGPKAVTFMGRVANIVDVLNTPKTPRSAKGCVKLCIKDDTGAITVRLWYAVKPLNLRLGSLVSVWTNHISNGENGTLSSTSAPLFASLFPERDRSCHAMIHENSDDGTLCKRPLGYRTAQPLSGLMTLQNFIDGGYDVVDAKILVVVKSIGGGRRITRKDETVTENVNLTVQDDTAEAKLGLWGTAASSPIEHAVDRPTANPDTAIATHAWRPGETVLLMQAPGWKFGRSTYLSTTSASIIDVNPHIPDADWLRRFALRQKNREAVNPPFPEDLFDLYSIKYGPLRCLFTIADLDEFARAAPNETFQGYLSVLITEVKLYEYVKRQMLFSGECCNRPLYASAVAAKCKGCNSMTDLRISPKLIGQVMDETAVIGPGKLLFSDAAWEQLLGRKPLDLLRLSSQEIKYLADRLLFCRVTLLFGWSGEESKAGGRVCVLGVMG
ncbi:hypothetical protein BAUCODRAFT_103758 [Baudoinia panamericana UAMH 10762]|uniref:Uncharacterized protein n=1 Tax=Baudoinia panamericana (strain UAMH 10762) TaxID=717646 RepID=M2MQI0_BAUPA|nr:uncharacterized protein BAUCODRAFT_103758 [Baudoinia panamericana UAMH 10762]EMC99041.1 hypothetical protein BAUCODRAFT_103758 [Baudoinia panamericana UAMH 10762]